MRFKNIINIIGIVVALGLWSTSCVEESGVEVNSKPAPEGEAFLSLKVKTGDLSAFTRGDEVLGSADELAVYSVRVVLYDGNESSATQCKVEYVFEYNLETSGGWTDISDPTDWIIENKDAPTVDPEGLFIIPSGDHLSPEYREGYEFATFAQRVKDKPYKMLVILNGQDEAKSFQSAIYKATNKGNFLYNFTTAAAATIDPQTGVLVDGKGILMTNHQGLVEVTKDQLTRTATEAHKAPVTVSVDRMVAKVTVKHADDFQFPSGIDKSSVTWGLDITNNFTYWMRKETTGEGFDLTMESLYAQDPNYAILSEMVDKEYQFNSLFVNNDGYLHLPAAHVSHSLGEYKYVLENTIDAKGAAISDYADQVTRLIVGYKYVPQGYKGTENYYIYQNTVISQEEVANTLSVPGFSIPGITNFKTTLEKIQAEGKYPLTGSGTDYFETYGLRYCPQGQLYYIIPIRHFSGSEGTLGCYGVIRNNIYEITINKLTPPEVAGPHLSADIHIQPWAQRSQGNTIGTAVSEATWLPLKLYHWSITEGINIYPKWWAYHSHLDESLAPEYETVMIRYALDAQNQSRLITLSNYKLDMLFYDSHVFSNSVPEGIRLSIDNPEDNVGYLLYRSGTVTGSKAAPANFCFVDENNNLLEVRNRISNAVESNPLRLSIQPELLRTEGDVHYGGLYVRYMTVPYMISKDGVEYRIKANNYAKYYNSIVDGKVVFKPDYGFQTEPIEYASCPVNNPENYNWMGMGDLSSIAVICERVP